MIHKYMWLVVVCFGLIANGQEKEVKPNAKGDTKSLPVVLWSTDVATSRAVLQIKADPPHLFKKNQQLTELQISLTAIEADHVLLSSATGDTWRVPLYQKNTPNLAMQVTRAEPPVEQIVQPIKQVIETPLRQ